MFDIAAKLFWYRIRELFAAMADKVDDILYTDEGKESLDFINLILLGWILLGLIVYILGNVIAKYLRKRNTSSTSSNSLHDTAADDPAHASATDETVVTSSIPEDESLSQSSPSWDEGSARKIPVCEGGDDDEVVEWVNAVFTWIYEQRVVSPVVDAWLSALNAKTRLSSTEHGILVDFKELLPSSGPPEIENVRQSWNNRADCNLNCDVSFEDIAFDVMVTQFKEKDKVTIPFILNVKKLSGNVNVECNPEDLTFVTRCAEPVVVQSSSEATQESQLNKEEQVALSDLVTEITGEALSSAIVPLRFNHFSACPRMLPVRTTQSSQNDLFETAKGESEERLLVKIIKATNLGGNKGCLRPYCIVEMDEPAQKFETLVVEGTQNPFWDEAFTFSVKDSTDLLFEIYDKDKPTKESGFLGLGIVGLEELRKNPSQRQIIPLQGRPLEDDDVSGALTVEFLFLDHPSPHTSEPTHLVKEHTNVLTNSRVTAGGTLITTTTIQRTNEEHASTNHKSSSTKNALIPNLNSVHAENKRQFEAPIIVAKKNLVNKLHLLNGENGEPQLSEDVGNGLLIPIKQKEKVFSENNIQIENDKSSSEAKVCENGKSSSETKVCENGQSSSETKVCENDKSSSETKVCENNKSSSETKVCENDILLNGEPFNENEENKTLSVNQVEVQSNRELNLGQFGEENRIPLKENSIHIENTPNKVLNGSWIQVEDENQVLSEKTIGDLKQSLIEDITNQLGTELEVPPIQTNEIETKPEVIPDDNQNGNEVLESNEEGLSPIEEVNGIGLLAECMTPAIVVEDDVGKAMLWNATNQSPTNTDEEATGSEGVEQGAPLGKEGEADLPGTALKELEKHSSPSATSKSTLIIHSVQRESTPQVNVKVSQDSEGEWQEVTEGDSEGSPSQKSKGSYSESVPSTPSLDRSRSSDKKKGLIGSLRRRLSFHRNRSKSAENGTAPNTPSRFDTGSDPSSSRSTSKDRLSPFKTRFLGGSTRSSISEASGVSGVSSRTYINENSTLIIETNENGIIKRYLIPHSMAHRTKWQKKRGIKLHVFNDHVFVATHLSGSNLCKVCQKYITRRPGKQSYECRGCNLRCHKSCHVKVDDYCSNSTINAMEVEYVHDPKGSSPKSI